MVLATPIAPPPVTAAAVALARRYRRASATAAAVTGGGAMGVARTIATANHTQWRQRIHLYIEYSQQPVAFEAFAIHR